MFITNFASPRTRSSVTHARARQQAARHDSLVVCGARSAMLRASLSAFPCEAHVPRSAPCNRLQRRCGAVTTSALLPSALSSRQQCTLSTSLKLRRGLCRTSAAVRRRVTDSSSTHCLTLGTSHSPGSSLLPRRWRTRGFCYCGRQPACVRSEGACRGACPVASSCAPAALTPRARLRRA